MKALDTIIAELIQLDPSLAADKPKLKKLIIKLQKAKPDTPIDPAFARQLKAQLIAELEASSTTSSPLSFMTHPLKYMSYGALGAAAVAVPALAIVLMQTGTLPPMMESFDTQESLMANEDTAIVQITDLDAAAFGSLGSQVGIGGGGGGGGEAAIAPETMISADQEAAERSGKMIAPVEDEYIPTIYRYTYDGALPALPSEVRVLRKEVDTVQMNGSDILSRLGLGLFDSAALGETVVTSFALKQDSPFGYYLYVDPSMGTVSINKNWETWPNPSNDCRDTACHERVRLQADDVPADTELIRIANDFVAKLAIDMSPYGQPVVQEHWRANYARATDKSTVWIPEDIQVVYPLVIEGKKSMEEWGNLHGLTVNVDIRHGKASGISQLTAQHYSASHYDGVDAERFAAALRDGSTYPSWQPEGKYNEVVIPLGTPEEVFVQRHQWDEDEKIGYQLLIPALHFPVANVPDEVDQWYNRTGVVLPLADEVYQTGDDMRIMPLAEPAIEPRIEPLPVEPPQALDTEDAE